jgi:hypothetical protein
MFLLSLSERCGSLADMSTDLIDDTHGLGIINWPVVSLKNVFVSSPSIGVFPLEHWGALDSSCGSTACNALH